MDIKTLRNIVIFAESKRDTLVLERLPVEKTDLSPVMSAETLDYHYGKLAAGYVKRYNNQEGDDDFNYGGAKLHNLFFPQLQKSALSNRPSGISEQIINQRWGDFDKFKDAFAIEFMKAQGSNWIYMDSRANIHTIHNHEYKPNMDIALIIDGWEHAWALDYQQDKQRYLDRIWRIINWSLINDRIQGA
jgi:superoxide dismutase, Fe-Mn family